MSLITRSSLKWNKLALRIEIITLLPITEAAKVGGPHEEEDSGEDGPDHGHHEEGVVGAAISRTRKTILKQRPPIINLT